MAETIRLMKKEQKKKAFVINVETIHLMNDEYPGIIDAINSEEPNYFYLDSVEMGHFGNVSHTDEVVAFEEVARSENCPAGYNLWSMGDQEKASQRVSIKSDMEIYTKAVVDDAIFFENKQEVLDFIQQRTSTEFFEQKVHVTDKDILINTKYGDAKGTIGNCYVISHGTDRIQLLTLGTESVSSFCIVDADNKIIKELKDLH